MKYIILRKKKSKKLTYNYVLAVSICVISLLPYLHDIYLFKGMKGFSGFSSFRVGIWVISLFIWGLFGWILAFINSKGKKYRFTILTPILMAVYQLLIYVINARKSDINNFSTKVILNIILILSIVVLYFKLKKNE